MRRLLAVALLVPMLAGCFGGGPQSTDSDPGRSPWELRCVHPYPCTDGSEWPPDLEGPFELKEVLHTYVASFDGTELEAWIGLPDLPEGVKAPVVLTLSPYIGACAGALGCTGTPGDPALWTDPPGATGVPPFEDFWYAHMPPARWVAEGFALAIVSTRGTGGSDGCNGMWDRNEAADGAAVVQWLAAQPWSNGRVGMFGFSLPGTTPLEAASLAPEPLKAIIAAGPVIKTPAWFTSPQGGQGPFDPETLLVAHRTVWAHLPVARAAEPGGIPVERFPGRFCTDVEEWMAAESQWVASGDRPDEAYAERDLWARLGNITSATMVVMGFEDSTSGWFSDDDLWTQVHAPVRTIMGPWEHWSIDDRPGNRAHLNAAWILHDWTSLHLAWFDYWLKGVGGGDAGGPPEALRLGHSDYEDDGGNWRESSRWPPVDARNEVLYLLDGALSPTARIGESVFQSGGPGPGFTDPNVVRVGHGFWLQLCSPQSPTPARQLVFASQPLEAAAVMAGNPMAYLRVASDQEGGLIAVHLLRVGKDFTCDDPASEAHISALSSGAADLRFHAGNIDAIPFPTSVPTWVRVDLWNGADGFEAGDRIAVAIGPGETYHDKRGASWRTTPYAPTITIEGGEGAEASHVVLPFLEGSLDGLPPELEYPAKPFVLPADGRELV